MVQTSLDSNIILKWILLLTWRTKCNFTTERSQSGNLGLLTKLQLEYLAIWGIINNIVENWFLVKKFEVLVVSETILCESIGRINDVALFKNSWKTQVLFVEPLIPLFLDLRWDVYHRVLNQKLIPSHACFVICAPYVPQIQHWIEWLCQVRCS